MVPPPHRGAVPQQFSGLEDMSRPNPIFAEAEAFLAGNSASSPNLPLSSSRTAAPSRPLTVASSPQVSSGQATMPQMPAGLRDAQATSSSESEMNVENIKSFTVILFGVPDAELISGIIKRVVEGS